MTDTTPAAKTSAVRPPGPRPRISLLNLLAVRRDRLGFLQDLANTYGDIASFEVGEQAFFLFNHPDLIRDVLVTHHRSFTKSRALQMEGILVLATIAQRWQLRLVPGHPVEPLTMITLRPKHGMRMVLQKRRGAD